jgi:hypothetical protein
MPHNPRKRGEIYPLPVYGEGRGGVGLTEYQLPNA